MIVSEYGFCEEAYAGKTEAGRGAVSRNGRARRAAGFLERPEGRVAAVKGAAAARAHHHGLPQLYQNDAGAGRPARHALRRARP